MSGNRHSPYRHSPWGAIDRVTTFAPGLDFVSTPSHGGFRLSPEMAERLPQAAQDVAKFSRFHGNPGGFLWFEEDCEAFVVALFFADLVPGHDPLVVRMMVRRRYPAVLAAFDAVRAVSR